MKFKIQKKDIENAALLLYSLANASSFRLIQGVLSKGILRLSATDMRNMLRLTLACESEGEGEFLIESGWFCPIFKELPDGEITVSVVASSMVLDWPNGTCQMPVESLMKMPPVPKIGKDASLPIRSIKLMRDDLEMILRSVAPATDEKNDLRPVLGGLFFDADKDGITVAGTDGQILLTRSMETPGEITEAFSFLVPKSSVVTIAKAMPKETEEVTLSCDGKVFTCSGDGFQVTSLCIEKTFPAYRTVMSKGLSGHLSVDRKDLLAAVRRAAVLTGSKEDKDTAVLEVQGGDDQMVSVRAQNLLSMSSVTETIPCRWDGEGMRLGFYVKRLVTALSSTSAERVTLVIDAPERPVTIIGEGDEGARGVLMPVPVKDFVEPKKNTKKKQ